ncbi:MAG: hypothetical protein PHO41_00390 [Eubacteriales bacterium]|nr:hypothetical protein [Eubacteriales bacterium]
MLKTFAVAFRLRNTYKTNSIIWALKGIPLIKKLLPSSLYASRGLKAFANIVSGISELFSVFLGKALYLFLIWTQLAVMQANAPDSFAHVLIFATIAGGFLNTYIFNPTKDKFYAIFLLRMDAKRYTLTGYFYFLFKMLLGFTAFSFLFGLLAGASVLTCLAIPVYVVCVKLCFTALSLEDCNKQKKSYNENKFMPLMWVGAAALLGLAALPYLGFALPEMVLWVLTAVLLIPAAFSLRRILRFDDYRSIYKELLKPENFMGSAGTNAAGAAQQLALQKKMTADFSQTSNKSGYQYFNELFMKRHAKLLTRSAKRITVGAAVLFAAAFVALYLFPDANDEVNELCLNYLPYFLFVMYLINRGRTITQAMFMNCDHSMLAYRFYRQPKALLTLFVARLKYVILINLMPAVVIALGLPMLLYITGGTVEPLNYVVLFVSIIAMSVFFSVHNMVLYYLLQPYNVNLESKSATFGILNWVTYMVSWLAIQVQLPTLYFGAAISAFCIIYAIAAFILAYRLAPKTFKLRS